MGKAWNGPESDQDIFQQHLCLSFAPCSQTVIDEACSRAGLESVHYAGSYNISKLLVDGAQLNIYLVVNTASAMGFQLIRDARIGNRLHPMNAKACSKKTWKPSWRNTEREMQTLR